MGAETKFTSTKDAAPSPPTLQAAAKDPDARAAEPSWLVSRDLAGLILKACYIGTAILCAYMIFWVMILPGTWKLGLVHSHEALLAKFVGPDSPGHGLVPASLTGKYKGHPLVQFTHNLPAALWSLILPFQLHPASRRRFPRLHRILGRVFFVTDLLMMFGVVIIFQRELTYDRNDFPTVPYYKGVSVIFLLMGDVESPIGAEAGVIGIGIWFTLTGAVAWYLAAFKRNFSAHKVWVVRHVAAGLWVILMRVFTMPAHFIIRYGSLLLTGKMLDTSVALWQKAIFGDCAGAAIVTCILVGEAAVYCIQRAGSVRKAKAQ